MVAGRQFNMIPKKYKPLLYRQHMSTLYFYFFCSFFVIIFEMLSVGMVPFFALSLTENNEIISKIFSTIGMNDYFDNLNKKEVIIFFSITLLSVFIIKNFIIGWINYLQNKILRDYKISTSKLLFEYYINTNYKFFLSTNPATLIRNITTDVGHAFNYFLAKIKMIRETIIILFITLILISINPRVHLIVFFVFTFMCIIFYYIFRITLKKRGEDLHKKNSLRFKLLNETFLMIKEIKVLKKEEYFLKMFKNISFDLENLSFFSNFLTSIPRLFIEVISVFLITLFSIILILSNHSEAYMISVITLMVASGARFIPGFNVITSSFSTTRWLQPSFNVITKEIENLINREKFKNKNFKLKNEFKFKKKLIIENLSFSYTDKEIIDDLQLTINKGEFIGIVGESGAGKTTFVNILLGLLSPTKGKILADETNIEDNIDNWQKKIGYIPQEVYLLDASIRENIAIGIDEKDIDQKQIDKLIKFTNLEDVINNLPEKSYSNVGFMGNNVSGGQKQRMGIARALYSNPEIIILDEATSSLDIKNENMIVGKLNELKGNKTLIIISHKRNSLKYCDQIFEIKEKKINKLN